MSNNQSYNVAEQYRTSANLNARIRLHERFSVNQYGWVRWIFDQFDLSHNSTILELGCGVGTLWSENRARLNPTWQVTLSDFSPGMLQSTQRNLVDLKYPFRFEVIDAESIPFGNQHFDAVIANHMLYYVRDKAKAFAEIKRTLKPGGKFYATTIGRGHMSELKQLVEQFAPGHLLTSVEQVEQSFLLETGLAQMSTCFPNAILKRYDDALFVTETQPLVDYIMSSEVLRVEDEAALTQFVQTQMAMQGGTMRITKDSGIFIASND